MSMETDALRWLQQVSDGITVTEVSEIEGVTQSGVSRALARLESQLGTPLLRRSGRTLRMTHAGAVVKPNLDALVHDLEGGIARVGGGRGAGARGGGHAARELGSRRRPDVSVPTRLIALEPLRLALPREH